MTASLKPPKRVLFAGLFHETHSFVDGSTGPSAFSLLEGDAMLGCQGDSSPMGGALAAAQGFGWHVIPALDMRAMPSGLVEDSVFEFFWIGLNRAVESLQGHSVDAVFLVLHGAMVTNALEDVEGELLNRLRALPGFATVPVFGVFDLHANFTAAMARGSDCLVAYRENPHTDAREAAVRAASLLERCLQTGVVPKTFWAHSSILWAPTATATADEPMYSLLALARSLEEENEDIWCVNVVAGFSFADTPDTGVSFTVTTSGPQAEALEILEDISLKAWEDREVGNVVDLPAEDVVAWAMQNPVPGLTVFAEPSDNIGGGAPGDGTGLLRVFLSLNLQSAAIAIADPAAVAHLEALSNGHPPRSGPVRARISVGGRGSRMDAGPVELDVELVSLSDGHFELADKNSHLASVSGDFFEMGPSAVVRHEGITILLTTRPTPPMDLAQWTSQGLAPAAFSYLGVKAAVAHRRAYEPIAIRMLKVETPGPCSSRLRSLPFSKVRRPIFPLDDGGRTNPSKNRETI